MSSDLEKLGSSSDLLPLCGRIFLTPIFIFSGIQKIFNFSSTVEYMQAHSMPMPEFYLVCAILFEVLGGTMILTGFKARAGAVLLMTFLVPATLIFHNEIEQKIQMIMFMKNLSIFGALCMVLAYGSGPYSIDNNG